MGDYTFDEMKQIAHDMQNQYGHLGKRRVLKEICRYANVDMKMANQALDSFGISYKEWNDKGFYKKSEAEKQAEQKQHILDQQKLYYKEQEKYYRKLAKCPRCGSTSISYEEPVFSKGRAMVGGLLGGFEGSLIMGLTGKKKGHSVCLRCGKRWRK